MSDQNYIAPKDQKSGTWIHTPYDGGPPVQQDTVSCKHCQRIWIWIPGSGRKRGWCTRCNGFTCGSRECNSCVPAEQMIENMEQGRPLDFRPIRVGTSGLIIPGG